MEQRVLPFLIRQMWAQYSWMSEQQLRLSAEYKIKTMPQRFPQYGVMLGGYLQDKLIATASIEPYVSPSGRAIKPAYLGNIFIDAAHQRQGRGTAIIKELERVASQGLEAHILIAETLTDNTAAIGFLQSQGFHVSDGTRLSSSRSGLELVSLCKGLVAEGETDAALQQKHQA